MLEKLRSSLRIVFGRPRTLLDFERMGDLPWQRPRRVHEFHDQVLFKPLLKRLTFIAGNVEENKLPYYYRDEQTGQLWELCDADIGHTDNRVLYPADTIPVGVRRTD